jgi:hypothetical protein
MEKIEKIREISRAQVVKISPQMFSLAVSTIFEPMESFLK